MTKAKKYKSDAFAAIHETAAGMRDAGVIDKTTMRSFDETCLNVRLNGYSTSQLKRLPDNLA